MTRPRPTAARFAATLAITIALAAAAAARAAPQPPPAAPARFTVQDQVAREEVSEQTDLYIDGRLIGHLHLDRARPTGVLAASVADGDAVHRYALCGEITVRRPDGGSEVHEVDDTGTISDVDGRAYQALGASDFTFFYLSDPAPGREPARPDRGRSPLCHPPLS